jgi:hypothetical protein
MLMIPHCLGNRLTAGGKVVSSTHQPHFTPLKHYFFLMFQYTYLLLPAFISRPISLVVLGVWFEFSDLWKTSAWRKLTAMALYPSQIPNAPIWLMTYASCVHRRFKKRDFRGRTHVKDVSSSRTSEAALLIVWGGGGGDGHSLMSR